MRVAAVLIWLGMVAAVPVAAETANETGGAAVAGAAAVRHPFLCTDNGQGKVFAVSAEGKIEWEYPAAQCQDCWRLPNGNYLFTHKRGVVEVTADAAKKVVWEYRSPDGTEIHNCQSLADGGVFLCENGTCRLLELDREGKVCKELKIETQNKSVHRQFRIARKLADGHYLVTFNGERQVRELDGQGKVLRKIAVPGDPFVAVRLRNGNTLVGCGDGHKVVEVDPADKVVWQIEENDLPGNPLRFVAGLQRLPNGNTVVCNWGGHGCVGQQPQVFEVTPDKKVVWQVFDNTQFKTISNIQLLDVSGDVTKGEVLR